MPHLATFFLGSPSLCEGAKSRGSGTANYHRRGAASGRLVGNQSRCAKNATIIYAHSAAEGEDVGAADFKVALMWAALSANNWRQKLPIIQHLCQSRMLIDFPSKISTPKHFKNY